MLISELFYSVQGEGLLAGVPSVFVRTSGCNLRCRWCDTPYASSEPEGEQQTVEEIVARVREYPARHVVLTGGEPMLAKGIEDLAGRLRRRVTILQSRPRAQLNRTESPVTWPRSVPNWPTPPRMRSSLGRGGRSVTRRVVFNKRCLMHGRWPTAASSSLW